MSDEDEIILADLDDEELVQQMFDDLYDGLREEIEEGVNILIERDWAPYDILTKALVGGMTIVGADFRDGILFVPEVLLAANAMKGGMAILKPLLAETGAPRVGKMVIGTVKGDIHDIGKNPDKKVGALNYGYSLVEHMDYLLGVDGDTTPEPDAIQHLVDEIASDDRVGGISAVYSIDDSALNSWMEKFLIAGQRAQFSAFNMQNLLKGRNMAVLGGQFSIFSTQALRDVMRDSHQRTPWVSDSEVEDSLLSLQIKSAGYLTKISARARAHVGGMNTLRSLDAQQVKWNYGAIDLMWPGQRGDTRGQPFHPNLRLRWFEHLSMVQNMTTRFLFMVLLAWSLLFDAFVFSPLWLIPPLAAVWLNFRVAHSMEFRNKRDYLFVLLIFPAELYMFTRMGHFVRAWWKFFTNQQSDNWAAQAKAERGKGSAWMYPFAIAGAIYAALVAGWEFGPWSVDLKSDVLYVGWRVLGLLTVLQTAWMIIKASKRYKGYKA